MASNAMKLVTGGDVVKVWNGELLEEQFSSFTSPISQVYWSPDGHFLASCSVNGDKISVSHFKCLKATVDLTDNVMQNFVRFGNTTSRYLVTCGGQSQILLWDLKARKIQKKLNTSLTGMNCITLNKTDTHIACGSPMGEIVTVNIVSGVCSSPMHTPHTKSICSMSFNCVKKSVLGAVSDDGGFNLWDVNRQTRIHTFSRSHSAPATGMAFSPVNDMLAISVGLDKCFRCYDLENKKVIQTVSVDAPLTCIDFKDGVHVAVGTTKGTVLVYDLRVMSAPSYTISAYTSAVHCLHFQKCAKLSKADFVWKEPNSIRHEVSSKPTDNGDHVKKESELNGSVFSPLQDTKWPGSVPEKANGSPLSRFIDSAGCSPQFSTAPGINGNNFEIPHFLIEAPASDQRLRMGNASKENDNSQLAKEISPRHNVPHGNKLANELFQNIERHPTINLEPCKGETAHTTDNSAHGTASSSSSAATNSAQAFNMSLLQNMVADVADDLLEKLHKDIGNLHVDMLKYFQIQQMQIETLFRQYSVNEELVAEIERLREENKRLRLHY